jgi:hypothetical protein
VGVEKKKAGMSGATEDWHGYPLWGWVLGGIIVLAIVFAVILNNAAETSGSAVKEQHRKRMENLKRAQNERRRNQLYEDRKVENGDYNELP